MRMRFFILVNIIVFLQIKIYSQNIVPNSSFESIDTCNLMSYGFNALQFWDSPTDGSPDVFNTCAFLPTNYSVPSNAFGFQHPNTGSGYAGSLFFTENASIREYIQVQLDSVLMASRKYCVSFYVSLSNKSGVAVNNIGLYFSSTHTYVSTNFRLNFIPQINNTTVIIDSLNWTLISGEYIALGGEKYIIIGNFYPNSQTDSLPTGVSGSLATQSYYYIDDVSVWDCTGSGIGITENSVTPIINITPNPATSIITVSTNNKKIEAIRIVDIVGKEIIIQKTNNNSASIDITDLADGVYFVEAITETGIARKKFIKE